MVPRWQREFHLPGRCLDFLWQTTRLKPAQKMILVPAVDVIPAEENAAVKYCLSRSVTPFSKPHTYLPMHQYRQLQPGKTKDHSGTLTGADQQQG